jgi:hypothetical protein
VVATCDAFPEEHSEDWIGWMLASAGVADIAKSRPTAEIINGSRRLM